MSPEHKHPDTGTHVPKAKVEMHAQTTKATFEVGDNVEDNMEQMAAVEKDALDFDVDLVLEEYQWDTAWLAVDDHERGTKAFENMRLWVDEESSQRYRDFAGRGRVYRVRDDQDVQNDEEAAKEMEIDEEEAYHRQYYSPFFGYDEEPDDFAPVKGEEPWTRGVCA